MSLESPRHASPSIGHGRKSVTERNHDSDAPATSVVRCRYMDLMAPHRSRMYDRAHITYELKANAHEVSMARVRRDIIAGEVQLAINRVEEAEALLQKRQHEVAIAKLHLQEAEEHIGWAQEHFRDRRSGQALILTKLETATTRSFGSSGSSSHASTSANSEEGDPSSYPSQVSNMEANEAEGGGNGKMNGSVVPLTVAALNKLQEQASQRSSE